MCIICLTFDFVNKVTTTNFSNLNIICPVVCSHMWLSLYQKLKPADDNFFKGVHLVIIAIVLGTFWKLPFDSSYWKSTISLMRNLECIHHWFSVCGIHISSYCYCWQFFLFPEMLFSLFLLNVFNVLCSPMKTQLEVSKVLFLTKLVCIGDQIVLLEQCFVMSC